MKIFAALAVLLAAPLADFGQSPLVDASHRHQWESLYFIERGEFWIDREYAGTQEVNGSLLPTVLVRMQAFSDEDEYVSDLIIAANCETQKLGIAKLWLFELNGQSVQQEVSAANITMDLASDPLSPDDRKVLAAACSEANLN